MFKFLIKMLTCIGEMGLLGYCVYKFSIIHYNREWTWYVEKYWYWYLIFFEAIIMLLAIIFDSIAIFTYSETKIDWEDTAWGLIGLWIRWSLWFLNILFFAITIYYIRNLILNLNTFSFNKVIDVLSYIVASFVVGIILLRLNRGIALGIGEEDEEKKDEENK